MRVKHAPQADEPPLGLLVRGLGGLGLALGGSAIGGDAGLLLLLVGITTTVTGGALFALEGLARWQRRRR
jgi:hypothetical protein